MRSRVHALSSGAALAGALLVVGLAPPAAAQTPSPSLVFSPSSLTVPEAGSGSYTVALGAQPSAQVTVDITGHSGTDLTLDKTSLTFTTASWQSPQSVAVTASADDDATHDRITLTHTASGGGYDSVTADLSITVTDTTRTRLVGVVGRVTEGESGPIRARLPMPLDDDITITVDVVPYSGRADEFELSANRTLTIAAGETDSTGEVTFTSLDDFEYEGVRYFVATLTADHGRVDAATERFAVVDDDNTEVIFQVTPSAIYENGGEAILRAYKYLLHEGVVKIEVSLEPSGRATLSGTTLTFQPGAVYATETLTVTAVDNADDEPDQTVTISGTVTEGRGVRTPVAGTLTVVDDENMPAEVALVLTPPRVREGLVSTVTAVASAPLDEEATIEVSASPGHADTRADDYELGANAVLRIPAGGKRSIGTVTIATVDDLLSAGSRRREVTVSGTVTGAGVADPADRKLTVLEDDPRVSAALVATPATIPEGGVSTITLRALEPVPADATVTLVQYSDAAELSEDPVLTIAAGATESTGTVTLNALQDSDTRNENITVVGRPSDDSRFVWVRYPAYVHVVDDDAESPAVTVSPVPSQLFEGETSTVIARLSEALSDDVTITMGIDESHSNHTASADDFTLSANRTLNIAAGSTESTGVVTLATSDDEYYGPEASRRVVLEVASVTGIAQDRVIKHTDWTIRDDEAPPQVTLAVTPASIAENNGRSVVTASMNTVVAADVEVTVTTAPVGGAQASDFVQAGSLLTIPANRKTGTGTVTITAVDDDVVGADKHLVVTGAVEVVGMEQSGLVWFPWAEGVTILDDDAAPVFDPDTASRNVAENTAAGTGIGNPIPAATHPDGDTLTYTLEGTDAASFGFDARTRQLSTKAGVDYNHEVKDSYSVEVKATDSSGATDTIAVTIAVTDVNEKPATPSAPDVEPVAGTTDSLSVSWTAPGLNGGPDIVGYRLRIKRTDQGTANWQTRNDSDTTHTYRGLAEDTEYEVQVRAQNGETDSDWSLSGTGRTHQATTETTEVRFGASTYTAVEGGAAARVTVRLSRAHGAAVTIPLTTTNQGGAGAGDYSGIPASVAFGASQTSASFDALALADDQDESGERVRIGFGMLPTDIDAGSPATATVELRDADETKPTCNMSMEPNPVTVHEGETARFTILISPPLERDDTLMWYVHTYGSATRDKDMRSRGTGGFHELKAGATKVTGEVETYADDEEEPTESFQIVMWLDSWAQRPDWRGLPDGGGCVGVVYILDGTGSPTPQHAFVSGAQLTLRYGQRLDTGSTPDPKDWVVNAATASGSHTLPVMAVTVIDEEVVLALSRPAAPADTVTVSYLPWAMHPLRASPDGAEAAPLTELPVRNETGFAAGGPNRAAAALPAPYPGAASETGAAPAPLEPWLTSLMAESPASAPTRLDLPDRGLTEVSALAGLTELHALDLSGNALTDTWPLATLSNLSRLDLSGNRIGDIAPLTALVGLEVLDLSGNGVSDVSALAALTNLRSLDLSGNRIADVAPLAVLAGLEVLDLSGNGVSDVSALAALSNLRSLDLSGNALADATALVALSRLQVLILDGNAVADPGPLAQLPQLARLDLSGNRVAEVALMTGLASLERLDLSSNRIAHPAALRELSGLMWLDLRANPVSDVSALGQLAKLRWLWLDPRAPGLEALTPMTMGPTPLSIDSVPSAATDMTH